MSSLLQFKILNLIMFLKKKISKASGGGTLAVSCKALKVQKTFFFIKVNL